MESKRNSLPSLTINKFFVSKRASMFEICEEPPRDQRERSPCGILEVSERKLKARKDKERKEAMAARRKRQADPYAEASTEAEDDQLDIECKICGHSNRSVNFSQVRRYLKNSLPVGECVQCRKTKMLANGIFDEPDSDTDVPVIWLCAFCGYQGCDRNSRGKHAFQHYKTPRSDPHCIVINTQTWTVWCYECDCEVVPTSSKKLHEVIQHVKRLSEIAPQRSFMHQLTLNRPTNLITQFSGSDSRLHTRSSYDEMSKNYRNQKNANALAALPKVKGIRNLGNTCFLNSVIQSLAQTHFLTHFFDIHMESGTKMSLPGKPLENGQQTKAADKKGSDSSRYCYMDIKEGSEDELEEEEELKPMDIFLPEGGALSMAFTVFLKDMHSVSKSAAVNPAHLFSQICKKSPQFQGYQQQDAHELLRCLLEAIKNEEIIRAKRAILRAFALSEKTDPNTVNARLRRMIKVYGKQGTHTIIDQIFGGQLLSTVFCEECHWTSQVFEPFMDLSLSINEEKGKPKKNTSFEDEPFVDCFGWGQTVNGHSPSSRGSSKNQPKKVRKAEKKKNRKNKARNPKGGDNHMTSSSIQISVEDMDEDKEREERKRIRLTEKRRPEDEEEYRLKAETEKLLQEERRRNLLKKRGESSKFKQLMQERNAKQRDRQGGEGSRSSDKDEDSDEEQEYDLEEDEDDSLLFGKKTTKDAADRRRANYNNIEDNNNNSKGKSFAYQQEEEDDDDDEEEESDDDEEESDTSDESESDVTSSERNSRSKKTSRETSDADVEDNADSEYIHDNYSCTRHPSIVVDSSTEQPLESEIFEAGMDNRYLMTCNSYDMLNENSYSDTSERYFTAAGPDTMDELDHVGPDATSLSHYDYTWKGDNISISSGDAAYPYDDRDKRVRADSSHMEEACLKVGEMKISRKSSSRESLLDSHPKRSRKKGSPEALHTFSSVDKCDDDEAQYRKSVLVKKLRHEWNSKSIATLAPRYQSGRQECSIMSCLANFTSPELLTGMNKISCENCARLRYWNSNEDIKSNASKQLLILSPPAVLTLHMKRFHHVGCNLAKANRYVQFPLILDIAPYTSSASQGISNMTRGQFQILYGLFAIVEHSGRLNSGHYSAYVRCRPFDLSKTSRSLLNLKPSTQFEVNLLINEMAERMESEKGFYSGNYKSFLGSPKPSDIESLEEEIRSGRWYHISDTHVTEVTVDKVLKAQAYLLFYERII